MKKIYILFIIIFLPVACYSQFIGIGGQYAKKSDGQFVASFSFPTIHPKNKFNSFISSGLEYTTYGGAKLSGLNLKPIQINTFFGEDFFNKTKATFMLGVDGGYLFNFPKGKKNGIIITPNLYFDYRFVFVKVGYDFDVLNGESQFFIRAGISIGLGALKIFENTKIW